MPIPMVVVDDDDIDRYLVNRLVKKLNQDIRLIEFSNGEDFLTLVTDECRRKTEIGEPPPPILVLLDINMPGFNGFDVLKALEKMPELAGRHLAIVMHSSSNHPDDISASRSFDFVRDYIEKPLSVARLDNVLTQLCLS